MGFIGYSDVIADGDTVIVYLGNNSTMPLKIRHGTVTQTRRGALRHSDIIGTKYGCRLSTLSDKGYVYLLQPTPELWTLNLHHRTQILYFADISLITLKLELKPGSLVAESGTGSGSVSHAFARTIAPNGHLYTFEFHEQRSQKAREEFEEHGISHLVTVAHRDVLEDGFGLDERVDAVFLDLPSPWKAIPHARKILKTCGGRLGSFSPCIEQVKRTCEELSSLGFSNVSTVECLQRTFDNRTVLLPYPNLGKPETTDPTNSLGGDCQEGMPDTRGLDPASTATTTPDENSTGEAISCISRETIDDGETANILAGRDLVAAVDRSGQEIPKGPSNAKKLRMSVGEDPVAPTVVHGGTAEADRGRDGITVTQNDVPSSSKPNQPEEGAIIKDKRGNKLNYPTRCAVPAKEMPGHTGFLTFADLFVLPTDCGDSSNV